MESERRRKSILGSSCEAKNGISCRIATSIFDLPLCILADIFKRLPITTILSCKCVCKTWYAFVSSNTDFAGVYLSNPPFPSVVTRESDNFCLLELKADYDYRLKKNCPRFFRTPSVFSERCVSVVGSCNGFLCFSRHCLTELMTEIYLGNPLLGEYVMLPQPVVVQRIFPEEEAYGFGFSPKTREYKVFRILIWRWRPGKTEAQVCTVGGLDNGWRVLEEYAPLPRARKHMSWVIDRPRICEVPLEGALHWITDNLIQPNLLYSFDIGDEKVRPVPHPVGLVVQNAEMMSLGVLRGCLCIYHAPYAPQLDIWWMKEYGVAESWTKESIMHSCIPHGLLSNLCFPIVIWRDGEVFMRAEFGYLFSYNPEEKRSTQLTINLEDNMFGPAVPYVPCFLSLKDVVKTGKVKGAGAELNFIMEPNKIKDASTTKQWNATTEIRDLPINILENIFARIPSTTIISMKCVCKTWYNLISGPHFGNTYFTAQCSVSLALSDSYSVCSFLELKTDHDYNAKPKSEKINGTAAVFSHDRMTFLGSCNGLICLSITSNSDHDCTLYITNPGLREYALLPQPRLENRIRDEVYGFGFCPATGHYKVLRILTKKWKPGKSEAHVLTIGIDDGWRTIGKDCPCPMAIKWPENLNKARFCEVNLKGALHWIVEDSDYPHFIYSFEMEEEAAYPIPLPPGIGEGSCWISLGVLRDVLCVFHSTCALNIDIWWMKDYGVVNSWTKESIVANFIPVGLQIRAILPILVWKNDEILMSTVGGPLISYCPREKNCTIIKIEHEAGGCITAAQHFPSFLSLSTAFKGGNLKVVRIK